MADFSNNIVNQRFRTLYDELYRQGHIRGKSDIAEKLGTYNHVINSILKGQRNITIEWSLSPVITQFTSQYGHKLS